MPAFLRNTWSSALGLLSCRNLLTGVLSAVHSTVLHNRPFLLHMRWRTAVTSPKMDRDSSNSAEPSLQHHVWLSKNCFSKTFVTCSELLKFCGLRQLVFATFEIIVAMNSVNPYLKQKIALNATMWRNDVLSCITIRLVDSLDSSIVRYRGIGVLERLPCQQPLYFPLISKLGWLHARKAQLCSEKI